jgi:hypothetical protein
MPMILKLAREQFGQIGLEFGDLLRIQVRIVGPDQLYQKSDRSRNFVLHNSGRVTCQALQVMVGGEQNRKQTNAMDDDGYNDGFVWPAEVAGCGLQVTVSEGD